MVEYWAHVQAFMPVDLWPVMQHRMASYRPKQGKWWRGVPDEVIKVLLAEIGDRGASTARELEHTIDAGPRRKDHWGWNWSEARKGLDFLYMVGDVAIAGRTSQFEVRYDLPERVIPADGPGPADAVARGGGAGAGPAGGGLARRRHAEVPGRLLPDHPGAGEGGRGAAGRGGRADPGPDRGLEQAGLPAPRRGAAAQGRGPGPPQPVRPGRLGAGAHRAALRLLLPDRDLHARPRSACTATTSCRSSCATRSSRGWTSRPTGRAGRCWCKSAWAEDGAPEDTARRADGRAASGLAAWLGLDSVRIEPKGDLAPQLRG